MSTTTTDADGNEIEVFDRSDVGHRVRNGKTLHYTDAEKDEIVAEWNANAALRPAREAEAEVEDKIKAEEKAILRQLAVDALTARGEM